MRNDNLGVMRCVAFLVALSACLPMAVHAENLWWAISFERTKIDYYTINTSYGAAWNYPTAIDAANAAYKECQRKARNPHNCEIPSDTPAIQFDDTCFLVYWTDGHGYDWFEMFKRDKATRSRRVKNVELIQCGE